MTMLRPTASLDGALRDARDAARHLARDVRRLGERHAADHDVLLMSRTLGLKLDEAVRRLARAGDARGLALAADEPDEDRGGGPLSGVRERASQALGSRPAAGALLLADLRGFLAAASDASVACVILAQGAQGAKDAELLEAVTDAHDTILRTHRWALTRLKTAAPQVLNGP